MKKFYLSVASFALIAILWSGSISMIDIAYALTTTPSLTPTATMTGTPSNRSAKTPSRTGTKLSQSQILKLTLKAGLDPALTTTPLIAPSITLESGIQKTSGNVAPNFYITTFSGKRWKLSDNRGKIVVLNFWASWCLPCRLEMPALTKIYTAYKDKGVTFVGVASSDTPEASAAFAKTYRVDYPIGSDLDDTIASAYGLRAFPTTFIIDTEGKVAHRIVGATDEKELRDIVEQMLN